MSEKKSADKKPIRDILQEKDAFLTTSEKIYEYFLRHTRGLIAAAAALIICVIAVAVYANVQKSAEAKSTLAFEKAIDLFDEETGNPEAGMAALEKVRLDHQGRKGSRLATLTLIAVYGARDESAKALPLAENMLQTLKPAEITLKPILLNNLGGLYESSGDYQRAAKSFEAILTLNHLEPAFRLETLMALGRVQAAAGQNEESIKYYQTVVKDFPTHFKAYLANSKVAELKGGMEPFPLPGGDLAVLTQKSKIDTKKENQTTSSVTETVEESNELGLGHSRAEADTDAPGGEISSDSEKDSADQVSVK